MIGRVRQAFWRHELWVLRKAQTFPMAAMFLITTLWLWGLPLVGFVALVIAWFPVSGTIWLTVIAMVVAIVGGIGCLAVVAPWHFRWYFIAFGLMVGRDRMATAKETQLLANLKAFAR